MPDAVAYPLLGLIAAGLVALALVWPQGQGAPSPPPFGHPLAANAAPAPPPSSPLVQPFAPGAGRSAVMSPSASRDAKP